MCSISIKKIVIIFFIIWSLGFSIVSWSQDKGNITQDSNQQNNSQSSDSSISVNHLLDDYSDLLQYHRVSTKDKYNESSNNANNADDSTINKSYLIKGKDFIEYNNPRLISGSPHEIHVIYFFWYGSPWSLKVGEQLYDWAQEQPYPVHFMLFPVSFGKPYQILSARIFFALKELKGSKNIHFAFMRALQKGYIDITKMSSILSWLSSQDIDEKKFMKTLNGYNDKVSTSTIPYTMEIYNITSTPSVVINGKYMVRASKKLSPDKVIYNAQFIISHLIKKDK